MKTYRVIKLNRKASYGRVFRVILPDGRESKPLARHEIGSWVKHHAGSLQEALV